MADLAAEGREALADVRKRAGTTTCWAGLPPSWRLFNDAIDRAEAAVDALSARLAQAEQERDEWEAAAYEANAVSEKANEAVNEARAAVAETRASLARLREYEEALTEFFAEFDGEDGQYAPTDKTEAKMRAALAGGTDG